jgi:hypothetical protein
MATNHPRWRPVALSLTVLGGVARLLPHPPNFTPVGSTALFAGARLPVWQAYLVPLAVMAVTDPILSPYYGFAPYTRFLLFSYLSFLVSVWLGRQLAGSLSVARIGTLSILNSVQFFLITNFGSWLWFGTYPKTASGLADCYLAAVPFFGWTLAGDLTYAALLFGLHAWLTRSLAAREHAAAA